MEDYNTFLKVQCVAQVDDQLNILLEARHGDVGMYPGTEGAEAEG